MFIDITNMREDQKRIKIKSEVNLMLASVIHEFRTPINSMQANINKVCEDESLGNQTIERMKILDTSTKILTSMIDDIMDIAKLDQGAFKIAHEEFNFKELIEELKQLF